MDAELLAQIFVECLPSQVNRRYNLFGNSSAPGSVSQVCQFWRQIALSLPILWSYMDLVKTDEYSGHRNPRNGCKSPERLFQMWLERASKRLRTPLTLTFPLYTSVWDIFAKNLKQWGDVEFDLTEAMIPTIVGLPGHEAVLLKSVKIYQTKPLWEDVDAEDVMPFLRALPNLEEMTWYMPLPTTLPYFLWRNMRVICIDDARTETSLRSRLFLLSNFPRLEVAKFLNCYMERYSENDEDDLPEPTLPYLHTLELGRTEKYDGLMDFLTLPALRHLELSMCICLDSLIGLDDRSSCRLESLTLADNVLPDCLLKILHLPCVQTLRSLRVGENISDGVLKHLTWDPELPSNKQYLPSLTSLYIQSCNFTDGLMASMALSRRRPTVIGRLSEPLETLYVSGWHYPYDWNGVGKPYDEDIAVLRDLADEGLEINTSFYPKRCANPHR
ncbi:hypothetical protein DXG01_015269 [Tephrocybe rancida]|nr:hypothetical protein DXG01_015269 [Tephrocybe rancida]